MLDDILITHISQESDVPEWQLRNNTNFWEAYRDLTEEEDYHLEDIIEYVQELAYRGELQFSWDAQGA
jgi:hypothetical protein